MFYIFFLTHKAPYKQNLIRGGQDHNTLAWTVNIETMSEWLIRSCENAKSRCYIETRRGMLRAYNQIHRKYTRAIKFYP